MEKFARIIDFPEGGQMLLTVDPDSESNDESYQVSIRCDFSSGFSIKTSLGFDAKKTAQEAMEIITLEEAIQIRDEMDKMFHF